MKNIDPLRQATMKRYDEHSKPREEEVTDEKKLKHLDDLNSGAVSISWKMENLRDDTNIKKKMILDEYTNISDEEIIALRKRNEMEDYLYETLSKKYSKEEIEQMNKSLKANIEQNKLELEAYKSLYASVMNNSKGFTGGLKKYVGMPAIQVIQDVVNPTDVGDLASAIRIGAVGYGIATGGATLGKIALVEGVGAVIDTVADYYRKKDEENVEMTPKEAITDFGMNFGMNLATVGAGVLAKKGVKKGVSFIKNKFSKRAVEEIASTLNDNGVQPIKAMAEDVDELVIKTGITDTTSPNIPDKLNSKYIDANSVDDASAEAINKATRSDLGTKAQKLNGNKVGKLEQISVYNIDGTVTKNIGIISDRLGIEDKYEMIAMYSIAKSKYKNLEDLMLDDNFVNNLVMELGSKDVLDEIKFVASKIKGDSLNNTIGQIFQNVQTQTEEVVKGGRLNNKEINTMATQINGTFYDARVLETENVLNTFKIMSNGEISNLPDFFKVFNKNGDILKSLYTGELAERGFTEEQRKTFDYFRELYFEKVLKMDTTKIFKEESSIIAKAKTVLGDEFGFYFDEAIDGDGDLKGYKLTKLAKKTKINKTTLEGLNKVVTNFVGKDNAEVVSKFIADNLFEDGKLSNKTNVMKKLKEFVKENNIPIKRGGIKNLTESIEESVKNIKETNTKVEFVKAINEISNAYDGKKLNRIWSIANKQEVLSNLDFFTTKGKNYKGVRSIMSEEEIADVINKIPDEDVKNELLDTIGRFDKLQGTKRNLGIEKDYMAYVVKGKQYGINDTTVDKMIKLKFGDLDNFNVLPEDKKIEFLHNLCFDLNRQQVEMIGKRITRWANENGIDIFTEYNGAEKTLDFGKVINYYEEAFGFKKGDITLKFDDLEKGVGGGTHFENGKPVITLPKKNLANSEYILGVLRHELEHAREFKQYNLDMEAYLKSGLSNKPTLVGKPILGDLVNGKKVTLEQLLGTFYNNHFYDFRTDSFEISLAQKEMREAYENLGPLQKFGSFLMALRQTTTDKSYPFITSKQLLETAGKNIDGEVKLGISVSEDDADIFITNLADNKNNIVDFIFDSTRKGNARRTSELFGKTVSELSNNNVGYSKGELIYKLRKGLTDYSKEFGIVTNETFRKVNSEFSDGLIKLIESKKTISSDKEIFSNTKVINSVLTSMIIGGKHFAEWGGAVFSNSSKYISNGEIVKGLVQVPKNLFYTIGMVGASIPQVTSDILENSQRLLSASIGMARKTDIEVRNFDGFINKLRSIGTKGGNSNFSKMIQKYVENSNQRRIFSQSFLQMAMLEEGINAYSIKGVFQQNTNLLFHGLQADDIQNSIISDMLSKSEYINITNALSYDNLTTIQKRMYTATGLTPEQFGIFKQIIKLDPSSKIPEQMIRTGQVEFDLMARSKTRMKGTEHSDMMYLMKTVISMAKELQSDIISDNKYGAYVGIKKSKDIVRASAGMVALTLGVSGVKYGVETTSESLFERRNTLELVQEDLDLWIDKPEKALKKLGYASLDVNPATQYLTGSDTGTPVTTIYSILNSKYKKGGTELGLYMGRMLYGAFFGSLAQKFVNEGQDKQTSLQSARKYMNSAKGKKEFSKYIMQTSPELAKQMKTEFDVSFKSQAKKEFLKGNISREEYNNFIQ